MALVAKFYAWRIIITEEKKLRKRTNGWIADGDDVYTRCIRSSCRKILKIEHVPKSFHDGRVTCVGCRHCGYISLFVFAGLKSDCPFHRKPGTFQVYAAEHGRCTSRRSNQSCACGGTIVILDWVDKRNIFCLSCHRRKKWH